MHDTLITAAMSLLGTLLGTLSGITAGSKLTAYRLQQLEEKVNRHNSLIERTFRLEGRMDAAEQQLNDLKDTKGGHRHD